jgi:hypothetical protein
LESLIDKHTFAEALEEGQRMGFMRPSALGQELVRLSQGD